MGKGEAQQLGLVGSQGARPAGNSEGARTRQQQDYSRSGHLPDGQRVNPGPPSAPAQGLGWP